MPLNTLLRNMVGNKKGWNSPENFARTIVRLAIRKFNFPTALEATAFVDGMGDLGIDGLAIALDDVPLTQAIDVEPALQNASDKPTLRLLFVQSKRPDKIAQKDIVLFGDAVRTFLTAKKAEVRRLRPSAELNELFSVLCEVQERRPDVAESCDVSLIFGYGGIWEDYSAVNLRRENAIATLRRDLPKARFEFEIWGTDNLVQIGQQFGPASKRKLGGVNLMELPPGDATGFIGYVAAQNLVDFASRPASADKAGPRIADDFMFADNVRAFLGVDQPRAERENPGAIGLGATLQKGEAKNVILGHNGIVIVADSSSLLEGGKTVELVGAQIVNGCQTTHVLVSRSGALEGCAVPIKIVVTETEALKDMIALASNTQAEVDSYDILARLPNVRALENDFSRAAVPLAERVWFQRRRNEPVDFPPDWKHPPYWRIVRPRHLLDAYVSTILGAPDVAHSNAQATLDYARQGIAFHPEHDPRLYQALAWMVATGRNWAHRHDRHWQDRNTYASGQAYPARHQYLLALWHLTDEFPDAVGEADIDRSGPVQERFEKLISKLRDPKRGERLGDLAGQAVDDAIPAGRRLNADLVRTKAFTQATSAKAKELRLANPL